MILLGYILLSLVVDQNDQRQPIHYSLYAAALPLLCSLTNEATRSRAGHPFFAMDQFFTLDV